MGSDSSILIRRARKSDLPALLRNLRRVVNERVYTWTERVGKEKKERLLSTIRDRRSLSLVAQFAGEEDIVGQLSLTPLAEVRKVSHVRNLSILVVDAYRERGVGKALLRYALEWAERTKGVEKIHLDVFSTNTRAINLYKGMGFEVQGVVKKQYFIEGTYVDDIVMGLFVKKRELDVLETL